jgi:hypothetical protein
VLLSCRVSSCQAQVLVEIENPCFLRNAAVYKERQFARIGQVISNIIRRKVHISKIDLYIFPAHQDSGLIS